MFCPQIRATQLSESALTFSPHISDTLQMAISPAWLCLEAFLEAKRLKILSTCLCKQGQCQLLYLGWCCLEEELEAGKVSEQTLNTYFL